MTLGGSPLPGRRGHGPGHECGVKNTASALLNNGQDICGLAILTRLRPAIELRC